ncbi:cytochrome P450 [Aspergillus bertholletiae]|uniref:Cytochrome P450 n=1 Tax=Aspergillus bertholletiae TaxID=1226010 RepID=A0A5N7AZE1_9EURO|nr:cytochrome P450 [Aspergillus bertholletiae]
MPELRNVRVLICLVRAISNSLEQDADRLSTKLFVYVFSAAIYNLYFHPLRSFRGPRLYAISRVPWSFKLISGKSIFKVMELHERYGEIVRIAPNELLFQSSRAWDDIMGHRKWPVEENAKEPLLYTREVPDIVSSKQHDHRRFRRILSPLFSAKAIQDQQALVLPYINLLIRQLHLKGQDGALALDATHWFNWTAFDIVANLMFGEPFGCLLDGYYHPWVAMFVDNTKAIFLLNYSKYFSFLSAALYYVVPRLLKKKMEEHARLTKENVQKRLHRGGQQHLDWIHTMSRNKEGKGMSISEMEANSNVIIIAGSETTATALSGATYYLTSNPAVLEKLSSEVRSNFRSFDEIDLVSVHQLPYLHAVIEESLRMFPPLPMGLPRITPQGGNMICGNFIPGNTILSIWHYPTYRSPRFFTKPDSFMPERWMGDPRFSNDQKRAFQPFHTGPRNCAGRHLAYAEMKAILARIVFDFDMHLSPESQNWESSLRAYALWEMPPLMVYFEPRRT